MAKKLTGRLMLNKIPRKMVITDTDKNGNKRQYIWIDVLEKKEPGQYGDTHTITAYNKATRETLYLCNLKPQEFGASGTAQAPASVDEAGKDDLPFD